MPSAGKWADESKACLEDLTDRDHFKASVVLRDTLNRLAVFLYREGDEDVTVNEMMLSEGWGRLEGNAYARFKGVPGGCEGGSCGRFPVRRYWF